jgi:hypothetical protein
MRRYEQLEARLDALEVKATARKIAENRPKKPTALGKRA